MIASRLSSRERGIRLRMAFLAELADRPLTGQEIADALQISVWSAHSYGRQLVIDGLVVRDNSCLPWFYSLSEEGRDLA